MHEGWRARWLDRLAAMHRIRAAICTALLLAGIATLDWFSGAEIAASLGYLLPISFAAWVLGRTGAAVVGVACAAAWLVVDLALAPADMAPAVEVVNLVVLTVALQLFGQLLASLRRQLDQAQRLAHTDALTGVHNRRAFWSAIGREAERCRRLGEPFSLAYIDVDGFKGVNDRFGHRAGDELLRRIAHALQQDLRGLDMVARLGGDEFALLLPGAGVFGAGRAVTRALDRLRCSAWWPGFGIDVSIGCLTVREAPTDADAIVARADELMYAVKRLGRGQVRHDVLPRPAALPPVALHTHADSPPSPLAT